MLNYIKTGLFISTARTHFFNFLNFLFIINLFPKFLPKNIFVQPKNLLMKLGKLYEISN